MSERRILYDELCRVLTDYEGNGADARTSADDLYHMLVKIQNRWEDCITSDTESCDSPMDWLAGTRVGAFIRETKSYHHTLISVRKSADFDYLYIRRQYRGSEVKHDDNFDYAGIFCKHDGLVYDGQHNIGELFGKEAGLETRGEDVLRKCLQIAVREAVEAAIGNDRNNLRIGSLSDERELEKLAQFAKYYAGEKARKEYLNNTDDGDCGGFSFIYRCNYNPERWTEDSLLAYILDPDGYVSAEAQAYIDSHQEAMLLDFLEADMIASEYAAILANPANPVHCVKRIMRALSASSAKTVTVTIRKDGSLFTFKTEAGQFRMDCTNHYNSWNIAAADRRAFERLFGRSADYRPEDIVRIEYARSVLYEAVGGGIPSVKQAMEKLETIIGSNKEGDFSEI